jgi:hypothetical protein
MANYYFVTFGRERGGYLELLGLAPDASKIAVKRKQAQYSQALDQEYRKAIQTAQARQRAGEITEEELKVQEQRAQNTRSEKGMKLQELKKVFESADIQEREIENSGQQMQADGWRPLYQPLEIGTVWNDLFRQPLDQVDMKQMEHLREQWRAVLMGQAVPSGLHSGNYTPAAVLAWIQQRCLFHLTAADMLWQQLEFTNRDYWERQIHAWSEEIEKLGLGLNDQVRGFPGQEWEYPDLCYTRTAMIDRLEAGDALMSGGPARHQNGPPVEGDLEEIIEALLEQAGR